MAGNPSSVDAQLRDAAARIATVIDGFVRIFQGADDETVNNGTEELPTLAKLIGDAQQQISDALGGYENVADAVAAAEGFANTSEGSADVAEAARALAGEWASLGEDVEITGNPGKFSALHHAAKALVSALQAQTSVQAAVALAEASGDKEFFNSKAELDLAVAGQADGQVSEVFSDETLGPSDDPYGNGIAPRAVYRKEGGAAVLKVVPGGTQLGDNDSTTSVRAIRAKFNERVSFYDFVPEGGLVDNNASRMSRAIDWLKNNGNGVIHLPRGVHEIGYVDAGTGVGIYNPGSNFGIVGDGMGITTLKLADGIVEDQDGFFHCTSVNGLHVADMTFDWSKDNIVSTNEQAHVFDLFMTQRATFHRVEFKNVRRDAIRLIGSGLPAAADADWTADISIQDCIFDACQRTGIGFQRNVRRIKIANSEFRNCGDTNIDFEPTGNGHLRDIDILNCTLEPNTGGNYALTLGGPNSSYPAERVRVVGGAILGNIRCGSMDDLLLANFSLQPLSNQHWLEFLKDSDNIMIRNIRGKNPGGFTGVPIRAAAQSGAFPGRFTVSNSVFEGMTSLAASYESCLRVHHSNNVFRSTLGTQIGMNVRPLGQPMDELIVEGDVYEGFQIGVNTSVSNNTLARARIRAHFIGLPGTPMVAGYRAENGHPGDVAFSALSSQFVTSELLMTANQFVRSGHNQYTGNLNPEGAVDAPKGAKFTNTSGSAGAIEYVKTTPKGTLTGWVAVA